ncbi:MAG: lytic transglycosylase domain-containing protein [Verrucomicrobiota bacterium]
MSFLRKMLLFLKRYALVLCVVFGVILGMLLAHFERPLASERATPENVWDYIKDSSRQQGLDPHFVYALAMAESSLNPTADSGYARGMMQMSRVAWEQVTDTSYRYAWNWHTSVDVAIDYLLFCKKFLDDHNQFSYPMLALCYRFGPYKVQEKGFQLSALKPQIENKIYQQLVGGVADPVPVPN